MKETLARLRGIWTACRYNWFSRRIDIGSGLRVYGKIVIKGKGTIHIGKNFTVSGIPGDKSQYVTLDTHDRRAVISIGDNVRLYAARISARYEIVIGNNTVVEESGLVDTDFHSLKPSRGLPHHETYEACRIKVGNSVGIGARSLILKGVAIGDRVIVGPGSIVQSSIADGIIVLGNPARPIAMNQGSN